MIQSKKIKKIQPSKTLAISTKAKEMKNKEINVIDFSIGEPDFDTPKYIQDGAIEALKKGYTRYTPVAGIDQLREEVAKKYRESKGINVNKENILVSSGAKFSLYISLLALINPGDEVLIPDPYWTSYPEMVELVDGKAVIVHTEIEKENKIYPDLLNKYLTNKTKVLILTNPSNPTGIVYDKTSLEEISKWAIKNDIYIISDEIYDSLIYDKKHTSIASLSEESFKRTITINGMSKAYAMTGWRIGFSIANREIISKMTSAQSHITSNASSISQYASYIALRDENKNYDQLEPMYKAFKERRDKIIEILDKNQLTYIKPEGAFYVMVDISRFLTNKIDSSMKFTEGLLNKKAVALTPGEAFGASGYIRISYANSMENIIEGLDKILEYINEIKE